MKKKIVYTDAPVEIERAFARSVPVEDDFLPSPEEFRHARLAREKQRVTIYLEKGAIEKFKAYAAKHGLKYQSMVNDVVSRYAQELK